MFDVIMKRDGRVVPFDATKITNAIFKAGKATGEFDERTARGLTAKVLTYAALIHAGEDISVEDIQDRVEDVLLESPYRKTAKAYVIYRDQHTKLRELHNTMDIDLINQYIRKTDWRVNENSNMDYSLQGLNNYISSEVSKIYWLNEIYTPEIRQSHTVGDFHIHDLNIISVYCVGWDLQQILLEGFRGAPGKVEAGPAKHFRAVLGQVVNFFYTLQGESAGAQAFSNFDTLLAPFIRYDKLEYKGVKQALQEFIFNINVPTRVGFQTPFTNVTLDLNPPKYLADQSVIIGGKPQRETYGEFQKEMRLFNQAFLEVLSQGDYKGRVFTFPIPTYNITRDFDWDDPSLGDLWEVTGKYGVPYFANFVNSDMNPDDARSMCCRLRIDNRELVKRGGGLFGSNPLTGSIGVVTLNLPRLGYDSTTESEFMDGIDRLMILAKESLETKRKVLESFTENNLYPYTKHYLDGVREKLGGYWKNHFSTIGLVGMNEACMNLFGQDLGQAECRAFACRVLDYMKSRLLEFQKETENNYNLEATPAEGASYRLAQLDKKRPGMVFANGTLGDDDRKEVYYTNSTQLPVNFTDDVFEALALQDEIQRRYTGGTVFHAYLGERITDPETVKRFVRKVCTGYQLPYFTLTPTFSICPVHGYFSGEEPKCPKCGEVCEVYSRVTGYLRPVRQWNSGKQLEFRARKAYQAAIPSGGIEDYARKCPDFREALKGRPITLNP